MAKKIETQGLEYLYNNTELYAIIVRDSYRNSSISFFTPADFSQQLGYLPHRRGAVIEPHEHKINTRIVNFTQEVLVIKEGRVKVNFYDNNRLYVFSEELDRGDVILLCGGGHGFEILEESVMIEIKQGPFNGPDDKEKFGDSRTEDTAERPADSGEEVFT